MNAHAKAKMTSVLTGDRCTAEIRQPTQWIESTSISLYRPRVRKPATTHHYAYSILLQTECS